MNFIYLINIFINNIILLKYIKYIFYYNKMSYFSPSFPIFRGYIISLFHKINQA